MKIEWTQNLSVSVKLLDKQHQTLLAIMNEMYEALDKGIEKIVIGKILAELTDFAKFHFATEEKYFEMYHYEGTTEHIIEHKKILTKVSELSEQQKAGENLLAIEVLFFLEDWLKQHLMKVDRQYIPCFHEHGLK
jgi:hemerythrin-like metal-binding protein